MLEANLESSSLVLRKFKMGTNASGSLSINIYKRKNDKSRTTDYNIQSIKPPFKVNLTIMLVQLNQLKTVISHNPYLNL